MHFENPLALIGLLGALIPLIIHLFDRRQAKPIPFAALDFILKTNKKLSRSLKWKQWLILLARILLISAIPFAFSQPFLAEDSDQATLSESPMSVVFIVDTSVSMGRQDSGGVSALEKAKKRVQTLVENLSGESNVAIVEGAGLCESRQTELSFDREAVLESVATLDVSDARGEPLRAFQVAEALLAQSQLPDKRVIIVSDFQVSNWQDVQNPWSLSPPPAVQLEPIPIPIETNGSILDVDVQKAREVSPSHVRITVKAQASGPREYVGKLTLSVGEKTAVNSIQIPAGETKLSTFLIKVDADTPPHGEVALDGDTLSADDTRAFALSTNRRLDVLCINGSPRNIPFRDELFFVEKALQAKEAETPIRMTSRTLNEVQPEDLGDADVIVLANILRVPDTWSEALQSFVEQGGGLLISGGDNTTTELNEPLGRLFPMPIRAVKSISPEEDRASSILDVGLSPLLRDHPVTRIFESVQNPSLYDARFHTYVLLDGPTGGPRNIQVIGQYTNGAPFLVEAKVKRGTVIFWSSTLDQDWGTLAIQNSFVPLLHTLLLHLGGRLEGTQAVEVAVGENTRLPFRSEDVRIELEQPDRSVRRFELVDQDIRRGVFLDQLFESGLLTIRHFTKSDPEPRVSYLPVHIPEEESQLEFMTPQQIRNILQDAQELEPSDGTGIAEPAFDGNRTNLWSFVLLALFALLAFEALLAMRAR